MGSSSYILLAVRSLPAGITRDEASLDRYFNSIVSYTRGIWINYEHYKLAHKPWFVPYIGTFQPGAGPYHADEVERDVIEVFTRVTFAFCDTTIDVYHVYGDCRIMNILSFCGGKLVETSTYNHENLRVHTGTIMTSFPFESTYIPCCITKYFDSTYERDFEYDAEILGPGYVE